MTLSPDIKWSLFIRGLGLLRVDGDELSDDVEFEDVKAIAQICPDIKELTDGGNSPFELLLHRTAELTERVCYTWGAPDPKAVKEWVRLRGELLELQVPMRYR